MTGSNNIPLGNRRKFGGPEREAPQVEEAPTYIAVDHSLKRGRSPQPELSEDVFAAIKSMKKRKRTSRWGAAEENKAAGLMGLTTSITSHMTAEQIDAYALHLRIEEISHKLRINDYVPADDRR